MRDILSRTVWVRFRMGSIDFFFSLYRDEIFWVITPWRGRERQEFFQPCLGKKKIREPQHRVTKCVQLQAIVYYTERLTKAQVSIQDECQYLEVNFTQRSSNQLARQGFSALRLDKLHIIRSKTIILIKGPPQPCLTYLSLLS